MLYLIKVNKVSSFRKSWKIISSGAGFHRASWVSAHTGASCRAPSTYSLLVALSRHVDHMAVNLGDVQVKASIIIIGGGGDFVHRGKGSGSWGFDHVGKVFHNDGQTESWSIGERISSIRSLSVSDGDHVLVIIWVVGFTDHITCGLSLSAKSITYAKQQQISIHYYFVIIFKC